MIAREYPRAVVTPALGSWRITLHIDAKFASDVAPVFDTQAEAVRIASIWAYVQRNSRPSRRLPEAEEHRPQMRPVKTPDLANCPQCNRRTRKAKLKAKNHPGTVVMGAADGTCFSCHKGENAATPAKSATPKPGPRQRAAKPFEFIPLAPMPAEPRPLTPLAKSAVTIAGPGLSAGNRDASHPAAHPTTILGSGPPSSFITTTKLSSPDDEVAANRRNLDAYLRRGNRNGATR